MHPGEEKTTSLCTATSLRDISEKASIANCIVCYIGYILLEIPQQRSEDFRESQELVEPSVLQNDGRILCDIRSSNVSECATWQRRGSR